MTHTQRQAKERAKAKTAAELEANLDKTLATLGSNAQTVDVATATVFQVYSRQCKIEGICGLLGAALVRLKRLETETTKIA